MTPPSEQFIARTRNPKLRPPVRFEPTVKDLSRDVVISTRRLG